MTISFLAIIMIFVPTALPNAFAHGGHQPPAADFSGKKVSLFVSLEPVVVASMTDPVYINARLFDQNTNENFQHVTYRMFFEKDGQPIRILTEGGQFGGQADVCFRGQDVLDTSLNALHVRRRVPEAL